ncbi:regulator of RNase E activity RraA [Variovorax boronicumulans]|uniref:RraA family protein n=1 Tax=Variovorax boronicumulans TaxID=436515 RepID=UPI002787715B|nr:RraA family protein [Variovorax boronicumulans]MDP9920903.1 regulator of RNase E activity RraA [Variovorax boronicumulans]
MSATPPDRRWKRPLAPFLIQPHAAPPEAARLAQLRAADVTRLSDLVGRMYTCAPEVRPLVLPALPMAGPAFTVKCPLGDNLGVMAAIRRIQPGDVLVVDGQAFTRWCMGGFELLKVARDDYGMAGLLVNGAWRDMAEAQEAGIPIYGLGVSPHSGPKLGPAELNVPVACGGVIISPGDIVCASVEGVAVVPCRSIDVVCAALSAPSAGHGIHGFLDEMEAHVAAWQPQGDAA